MGISEDLGLGALVPNLDASFFVLVLWVLALGFAATVFGFWITQQRQYKVGVILLTKRGDMLIPGIRYRAKKVRKDDGTQRYYISGIRKKIRIPDFDYISPSTDRKFPEGILFLEKLDEETYVPLKLKGGELTNEEQKIFRSMVPLANTISNIREINSDIKKTYDIKTWAQQNLPLIIVGGMFTVLAGVIVVIAVLGIDYVNSIQGGIGTLSTASDNLATALEQYNQCNVEGV
ncbi:MAG: hypothetical protein CL811_12595 [Colwelliaceae bacterium]|jgi:hypothetical protein|nr:hypothetical protein [Colwelliaceae bacterium]|tara:strand:+ start:726 stop:1424 length:699 start_codon:yes stop_codon:yes gene_type:complete